MQNRTIAAITCAMVAIVLIAIAAPAAAQDNPRVDVSVGYASVHDNDMETVGFGGNLPAGWTASVAGRFGYFSLVGEVGGNYKKSEVIGIKTTFNHTTFLGGARVSSGKRFTPFGQMLVGAIRRTNTTTILGQEGLSVTANHLTLEPGVGLDIAAGSAVGIRVQGDYRMVRNPERTIGDGGDYSKGYRFGTGLVFFIGGR